MSEKPKLHIAIRNATHFLKWERPIYAQFFDLVDAPGPDVFVHGYATDTLFGLHEMPARSRSAYLTPGWIQPSPLFDLDVRSRIGEYVARHLDIAFINPGPLSMAFDAYPKFERTGFTIDVALERRFRPRHRLESLIHVSADYPEKDWRRNEAIMRKTGMKHEVYPPRVPGGASRELRPLTKAKRKLNAYAKKVGVGVRLDAPRRRYVEQAQVLKRMLAFDGFVHVAAPFPPRAEALYAATFLEAGLTGSLLFWHDTHGHGGYLETVFELPVDPDQAAEQIRSVATTIDIEGHSRRTHKEIREVFDPQRVVAERCHRILEAA